MPAVSQKNKEAVDALQMLFISTYSPDKGRDALCYRYKVHAKAWGKDVVSQKLFSAANHYTVNTFKTYLGQYRMRECAANGELAGEK